MIKPDWQNPQTSPVLLDHEVHFWMAWLYRYQDRIQTFSRTLSQSEMKRAGGYRFEKDYQEYVLSHGILRDILSRYMTLRPEEIEFHIMPGGKPYLDNQFQTIGECNIKFNLSHSFGLLLVSVTVEQEVGVDLEYIQREMDFRRMAPIFCTQREQKMLSSLIEPKRREVFFTFWTCKEAFSKACGQGLSLPLREYEIMADLQEPKRVILFLGDNQSYRWLCAYRLDLPFDYAGAFVVEGNPGLFHFWLWDEVI